MMGTHSRPPNPIGDHGHQQQQQDETETCLSAPPPRVDERQTGNATPTGHTFLRTTSPLSYTATVYRVASQLLKGGHNSQTDDYLSTSKNPRVSLPCARLTRVRVYLR
ncbi:hypothetical protein E2C01_087967 [Portunus trituberculatus]|uniref:Uncharacterized protein n=1 Tax=Portunus trituberculatus TaxID=210409 RepID=A0A5B7JHX3_PORTR|nr:hypothetical protein [Portunus trituberculatus]